MGTVTQLRLMARNAGTVAIGVLSMAAVAGAVWGVLSGVGAVVAWLTVILGGEPEMWALSTRILTGVGRDPGYAEVGFVFLLCLCGLIGMGSMLIGVLVTLAFRMGRFVLEAFGSSNQKE